MDGKRKDAIAAVSFWAIMMLAYYMAGAVQRFFGINISSWVNIVFLITCLILVLIKKQNFSSLGLSKEGIPKSCKAGVICGAVIVAANGILPGILHGRELIPAGQMIVLLAYFMLIIALPEELIFRGYIMTRFAAAMKNSGIAILLSGILFVLIHIPYQLVLANVDIFTYLINGSWLTLLMTLVWHIIFCFMFRKTNAIYGVIMFHGFMDWSNYIFK